MEEASEIESFIDCNVHQPDPEGRPYDIIPHGENPNDTKGMFAGQGLFSGSLAPSFIGNRYEYDFFSPTEAINASQIPAYSLQPETSQPPHYFSEWHLCESGLDERLHSSVTSASRVSILSRAPHELRTNKASDLNFSSPKETTPDEATATPIKDSGLVDVSQPENDNHAVASKSFPSERADLDLTRFKNSTADASRVLLFLGSTLRSKADKFIDASMIVDPRENSRRPQGKELFFPDRLYQLLEMSEKHGWTDIVSFQPHGRSFRVHDKAAFVARLLPICLQGQGSWSSFLRQLRLYGFTRCESGPDYGAYYHELFLRGRPSLTRYMRRAGVSHGGLDRRTFRLQKGEDPDFYHAYAPMPPLHTGNEAL